MNSNGKIRLSVQTLGCRLNQYETERMAADFLRCGFRRVDRGEVADLYLINTCTVTHRADANARNLIRRANRQNPQSKIVVAGCYVDNDPSKISGMEGVDVIIRNNEKSNIIGILSERIPELFATRPEQSMTKVIDGFHKHNRAWIKISDGCNQRCSFCIIPSVRGPLANRSHGEIIDEINLMVANGYDEVVLTGVHIGHYKFRKSDPQVKNLAALCRMILEKTDLHRLRISSIEPQTVRDELIEIYAGSQGRICRHFHLPLQSGSHRILRQMRRPYGPETYLKRVAAVKQAVPDTNMGADVIVGFPGETEDDFDATCHLVEDGLIDYLHVFSYSDRPGTASVTMSDKINPEVIKNRNGFLTEISRSLRYKLHQQQIGQVLEVISEYGTNADGYLYGISDNYIKVKLPLTNDSGKAIVKIRITDANEDFVTGVVDNGFKTALTDQDRLPT